jgi:protocatechuate 3,4-dioxygenase beta subunit
MPSRVVLVAALLTFLNTASFGANRLTLTGKVADPSGAPVKRATVIVYHAGVRQGYSALCPSCYADCGKRSTTDDFGDYTIENLNPDLWFELLVVRDGYAPAFLKRVEPSNGSATTVVLHLRKGTVKATGIVRGHVADLHGSPLRDAVVETQGIAIKPHDSWYGPKDGLDPLAVTNDNGDFEISYNRPAYQMLVAVEARTKAQKFSIMPTGTRRQTIVLSDGAAIRGRLVANGKPVGGAEIGLYGRERGGFGKDLNIVGSPYSEIRVGTQEDGYFAITNVPAPGRWYIYAKMESVAHRGGTEPIECVTTRDKEVVDVGDIKIGSAHRLQGKLILSDGKSIADGMRVIVSSEKAWDFQTAIVEKDGHFEFFGLPAGQYLVGPSVRDYELPNAIEGLRTSVDRDVDSLVIVLNPTSQVPPPH